MPLRDGFLVYYHHIQRNGALTWYSQRLSVANTSRHALTEEHGGRGG